MTAPLDRAIERRRAEAGLGPSDPRAIGGAAFDPAALDGGRVSVQAMAASPVEAVATLLDALAQTPEAIPDPALVDDVEIRLSRTSGAAPGWRVTISAGRRDTLSGPAPVTPCTARPAVQSMLHEEIGEAVTVALTRLAGET